MMLSNIGALLVSSTAIIGLVSCTPSVETFHAMTQEGPVFTNNVSTNGIIGFKGIPFAKPPVGSLRWRPPVSMDPWTEPLNTTLLGNACYTWYVGLYSGTTQPQSEDCLYMNIWTGTKNMSERRPVMVWVHGGGFEMESGTNTRYDGTYLAEKDVVTVTFDYRMGNFGFLARRDLDDEDPVANSGNYGLQDMIQALHWVKDNIASFGGDPDNVLLFGESAGGHSMGLLMAAPQAQGLYHKVIIESGGWWDSENGNTQTFDFARQRGEEWGRKFGPDVSLKELRQLPAQEVVNASLWDQDTDPATNAFSPAIDNYIVPDVPAAVFAAGKQAKVPLLAGFNTHEDTIFEARALPHPNACEFRTNLYRYFDVPDKNITNTVKSLNQFYPANTDLQANQSASLWIADFVVAEQTWEAVHVQSLTTTMPTYVYHFTYTSAYTPISGHTVELPFVWGTFQHEVAIPGYTFADLPDATDVAMSEKVMTYWTNFAKSSNPNVPDTMNGTLPHWPVYVAEGSNGSTQHSTKKFQQMLELGNNITVSNFDYSRFEFLRSFRNQGYWPSEWRNFVAV